MAADGETEIYIRTTRTVEYEYPTAKFDIQYVKSPPGILKCVQILLCLLAFFVCITTIGFRIEKEYSLFITFVAALLTFGLLALFAFHVDDAFPRLPWAAFELVFYALWTFLLGVATLCMLLLTLHWAQYAAHAGRAIFPAFATFLCLCCTIAFGVGVYFAFVRWREFTRNLRDNPTLYSRPATTRVLHQQVTTSTRAANPV